ncbi:unnamed protein product [Cochlearia groenlandica]
MPAVDAADDRADEADGGHVSYATLRVEDILSQPGHDSLRRLDPHKSADTYWGTSPSRIPTGARHRITSIIHGSNVSAKVALGCLDQRVREDGVHQEGEVSSRQHDDHNASIAEKYSTSKNAKLPDGTPKQIANTSGQIPFEGRMYDMTKQLGHKQAVSSVFKKTHMKKTSEFVDAHSERIFNDLEDRKTEIENQRSQRSPGGTQQPGEPLTTVELDQIFEEVAPKKKMRIIGMGSMQDVPLAPITYRSPTQMEVEIQELRTTQAEGAKTMAFYNCLFTVLSASNPELLLTMHTHPDSPTQAGPSTIDPDNPTQNYFGDDIDFNLQDDQDRDRV